MKFHSSASEIYVLDSLKKKTSTGTLICILIANGFPFPVKLNNV